MAATPATRDSERTRRALLAAGEQTFAEHGYRGATAARIAARARINKAMINYHFGGKLGLYRAILAQNFAPVAALLDRPGPGAHAAEQRLAGFLATFADLHQRHPALSVMILREVMSDTRALEDELARMFARIATLLRGILEQGIREGSFRKVDPLLTHVSIIGSLTVFFATRRFRERMAASGRLPYGNRLPSPADYVRHLQQLVLGGIACTPRESR